MCDSARSFHQRKHQINELPAFSGLHCVTIVIYDRIYRGLYYKCSINYASSSVALALAYDARGVNCERKVRYKLKRTFTIVNYNRNTFKVQPTELFSRNIEKHLRNILGWGGVGGLFRGLIPSFQGSFSLLRPPPYREIEHQYTLLENQLKMEQHIFYIDIYYIRPRLKCIAVSNAAETEVYLKQKLFGLTTEYVFL
jgi:hypothetical protein